LVALTVRPALADTGFLDRSLAVRGGTFRYQVYVPAEFTSRKSWPIIVWLHANGSQGDDALLPTVGALADQIRRHRSSFPAIVLFPQAKTGTRWAYPEMEDLVMSALDRTVKEFRGDPAKVYLAGHSMGGNGAYRIAFRWPERFAALLVVSGSVTGAGSWTSEDVAVDRQTHAFMTAPDPFAALVARIGRLPIWMFHGDADETVPVDQSRRMVAALRLAGSNVRYTEFPGGDHNGAPGQAFDGLETLPWLLSQRR
jgi:predicted peptidase